MAIDELPAHDPDAGREEIDAEMLRHARSEGFIS